MFKKGKYAVLNIIIHLSPQLDYPVSDLKPTPGFLNLIVPQCVITSSIKIATDSEDHLFPAFVGMDSHYYHLQICRRRYWRQSQTKPAQRSTRRVQHHSLKLYHRIRFPEMYLRGTRIQTGIRWNALEIQYPNDAEQSRIRVLPDEDVC